MNSTGKLYTELADWWHLFAAPAEYAEASAFYWEAIRSACSSPPTTLLELGSGGGNAALFLKQHCKMTLVDIAPEMLAQSARINPECEHLIGDMRSIRLNKTFDAIFVQDAISYMLTAADLKQAIQCAFLHCSPGGAALFAPDYVSETFQPSTGHGGHDGEGRSVRYLEWTWDPDTKDSTYLVDFAYMLRGADGELHIESDRLRLGLFSRADWLRIMQSAGFEARTVEFTGVESGPGKEVFLGVRHQ